MIKKVDALMAETADIDASAAAAPEQTRMKTVPGQQIMFAAEMNKAMDERDKALQERNEALSKVDQVSSELQVFKEGMEIDVDLCDEVPGRRRKLSNEEYAELRENLRNNDLIHPIRVRPKADGRYEIVSGANRRAIYKELGRKKILAVVKDMSDAEAERGAFYANLMQTPLTDYEKYLGFKKWQTETGIMQKDMALESGINPKLISLLFSFDDLPENAKAILNEHKHILGASAADKMAAALKKGKEGRVVEAIQKLAQDPNFTQVQAVNYVNAAETHKKESTPALVINDGKKKFCELKVRGGVLGIQFSDAQVTAEWADKIKNFIESEKAKKA